MEKDQEWVDITELIKLAASQLTYENPMLVDPEMKDRILFDAMSAIEIMDPKMDQCATLQSTESIESILDVKLPQNLTFQTIESFLKSILIHEVSFLEGASVLESTHQCVLLWQNSWTNLQLTADIGANCIISYCKALNKSLFYLNKAILDSDIYEEEDFQAATNDQLCETLDDEAVIASIQECLVALNSTPFSVTNSDSKPQTVEVSSINTVLSHDISPPSNTVKTAAGGGIVSHLNSKEGVTNFLEFRLSLLKFSKSVSIWIRECTRIAKTSWDQNQHLYMNAQLADMVAQLSNIKISLDKLKNLYSTEPSSTLSEAEIQLFSKIFSTDLVKLVQTGPVRTIVTRSFPNCLDFLKALFEELSVVGLSCIDKALKNRASLTFDFFVHAAGDVSRKCSHLVTRSIFKSLVDSVQSDMPVYVSRSMSNHGIPKAFIEVELIQKWLAVLGNLAYESVRSLLHNRCKIIYKLDQIIGSWGVISNESQYVDRHVHMHSGVIEDPQSESIPVADWFVTWSLLHTTFFMDVHMELLVELELLGLAELDYFYWYWDYLCASRSFAIERLRNLRLHNIKTKQQQQLQQVQAANNKSKKNSNKPAPKLDEPTEAPSAEELYVNARCQLCRGMLRMMFITHSLKLVDRQPMKHTTWEKKFDQRFRAFQNVQNPPFLSFQTFEVQKCAMTNSSSGAGGDTTHTVAIAESASICFNKVRQYLDLFRESNNDQQPTVKIPIVSDADEVAKRLATKLYRAAVANSVNAVRTLKLIEEWSIEIEEQKKHRIVLNSSHYIHYPVVEVKKI